MANVNTNAISMGYCVNTFASTSYFNSRVLLLLFASLLINARSVRFHKLIEHIQKKAAVRRSKSDKSFGSRSWLMLFQNIFKPHCYSRAIALFEDSFVITEAFSEPGYGSPRHIFEEKEASRERGQTGRLHL